MADPAPRINPGAYWGLIQSGAGARRNVVQMQQAIHTAFFLDTGTQGVIDRAQFNRLIGLAVGNREASRTFNSALMSQAIGPEMLGAIPNAPAFRGVAAPQRYIVQLTQNVIRNDVAEGIHRTFVLNAGVFATKSEMVNWLSRRAALLSGNYPDETHVGVEDVSILRA